MRKIIILLLAAAACVTATACSLQLPDAESAAATTGVTAPESAKTTEKTTEKTTVKPDDKATENTTSQPTTEAPAETTAEPAAEDPTDPPQNASWKTAYIEYLDSLDESRYRGFELIYIDDDDIPELVAISESHIGVSNLCWIYQDELCKENISFIGIKYFEKENRYFYHETFTGAGFESIRSLNGSESEIIKKGNFCTVKNLGEYYCWDGVDYDTKDEYDAAVDADFDKNAAKSTDDLKSYSEIRRQITSF